MIEAVPIIILALVAALQSWRLDRLNAKLMRLDNVLATHLEMDPRYRKIVK